MRTCPDSGKRPPSRGAAGTSTGSAEAWSTIEDRPIADVTFWHARDETCTIVNESEGEGRDESALGAGGLGCGYTARLSSA